VFEDSIKKYSWKFIEELLRGSTATEEELSLYKPVNEQYRATKNKIDVVLNKFFTAQIYIFK